MGADDAQVSGNGDEGIIDLSTSKAVVGLPGVDKPVDKSNLLSRDQHLAALNAQAEKFKAQYAEAAQLAELLKTDQGAEQLTAFLVGQGYGKSIFDDDGSDDDDNTRQPKGGQGGSVDSEVVARLSGLQQQYDVLVKAFADLQAQQAIEKEVATVTSKNPKADLQKLATLAQQKRGTFNLADALALSERDDLERENADLKERLRRAELAAQFPGLDGAFEADQVSKPRVATKENRDDFFKEALRRAAANLT